jgi:hypothetical protein
MFPILNFLGQRGRGKRAEGRGKRAEGRKKRGGEGERGRERREERREGERGREGKKEERGGGREKRGGEGERQGCFIYQFVLPDVRCPMPDAQFPYLTPKLGKITAVKFLIAAFHKS